VLGLFLNDHLQRINGLKTVLSLVINSVALLAFVLFGPVIWSVVLVVAPSSLLGGYAGAGVARRLNPVVLRATVVVFGAVVGLVLLLR
jgi:uncharacterized membrane protein YfcA